MERAESEHGVAYGPAQLSLQALGQTLELCKPRQSMLIDETHHVRCNGPVVAHNILQAELVAEQHVHAPTQPAAFVLAPPTRA